MQAGDMFTHVPDMSSATGAATDFIQLFDAPTDINAPPHPLEKQVALQDVQGRVRLTDVHFRYPTRPTVSVLRGLNLDVAPGTYVALVGGSGCGKSTM